MKKKIMSLFAAVVLFLFALASCNADDTPPQNTTVTPTAPATQNQPDTGSQAEPAPPIGNPPPANLAAEPEDMFTHIFDPELGGLRITQYHGELTQVMLPDEIMGFPIVAIDSGAFDMLNVTDVFFPDSVQYFGWGGHIYGVTRDDERPHYWVIPYGVTHLYRVSSSRHYRFIGADVRRMDIPPTVRYIGERAFDGFSSLTSVTIPNGVTRISEGTFWNTPSLLVIHFPPTIEFVYGGERSGLNGTSWWASQPDGVVYVGSVAYRWKGDIPSNTTVVIRDGTVTLGANLFRPLHWASNVDTDAPSPPPMDSVQTPLPAESNIVGVTLPDSLREIGSAAFRGTSITEITLPEGLLRIGGANVFRDTLLTEITLPNSVEELGVGATAGNGVFANTLISSITLPLNIVSMANNHAWGDNINTLYIQAGVDSIALGAGISQQRFYRSSGEYWGNIAIVWLD